MRTFEIGPYCSNSRLRRLGVISYDSRATMIVLKGSDVAWLLLAGSHFSSSALTLASALAFYMEKKGREKSGIFKKKRERETERARAQGYRVSKHDTRTSTYLSLCCHTGTALLDRLKGSLFSLGRLGGRRVFKLVEVPSEASNFWPTPCLWVMVQLRHLDERRARRKQRQQRGWKERCHR